MKQKNQAQSNQSQSNRSQANRVQSGSSESTPPARVTPPQPVLIAAGIAILQSIVVIAFGIFLLFRTFTGAENGSMIASTSAPKLVGLGTAVFLFICFGFVIASAIAMTRGKRWGRGAIVLLEFILAASAFQMMSGGAMVLGIVVLVLALVTLALLMFVPASIQWAAAHY